MKIPVPEVLHETDLATPSPSAFTTPPSSLTLAERTQRAIAEFDAVLDSELDVISPAQTEMTSSTS